MDARGRAHVLADQMIDQEHARIRETFSDGPFVNPIVAHACLSVLADLTGPDWEDTPATGARLLAWRDFLKAQFS